MASTGSDWIVTMDEDGQHNPADVPRLIDAALAAQAPLVHAGCAILDGEPARRARASGTVPSAPRPVDGGASAVRTGGGGDGRVRHRSPSLCPHLPDGGSALLTTTQPAPWRRSNSRTCRSRASSVAAWQVTCA